VLKEKPMAWNCNHQCHEVGGPWIAEDPNCPVHGYEAQAAAREQQEREDAILAAVEILKDLAHGQEHSYHRQQMRDVFEKFQRAGLVSQQDIDDLP